MRYIRYACIAVFAVALIAVSLANRQIVTLKVLPTEVAGLFSLNPSIELPLFVVIFIGIALGVIIGFVWEYLREHQHRAAVTRKDREVGQLKRELRRVQSDANEGKDEVLALLDDAR